jgi:hypothetical protein
MTVSTTNKKVWIVEFRFLHVGDPPLQTYEIEAESRVKANAFGWRYFNQDYEFYSGGIQVQTREKSKLK